jgi:hypothetical protein
LVNIYDEAGLKLLKIRNPWGNGKEWRGDWSNHSDLWWKDSRGARVKALSGGSTTHDGVFFMSFEEFGKYSKFALILPKSMTSKRQSRKRVNEYVLLSSPEKFRRASKGKVATWGEGEPDAKRQKTDETTNDTDKQTVSKMLMQGVCAKTPTPEELDVKRQKTEDESKDPVKEALSRMFARGVCEVLQHWATLGKGQLLVASLAKEFQARWKATLDVGAAGYSDMTAFLKAWPNKFEVTGEGTNDAIVSLVMTPENAHAAKPQVSLGPSRC